MSQCYPTTSDECDLPSPAGADGERWNENLASFERIATNNRASLIWTARRLTPFYEDAEDIVQESLLRAFHNLSRFRGEAKMSTWIQSIVRNTARDWLRRQRGRIILSLEHIRNEDDESKGFDVPDPARGPEDLLAISELESIMLAEVDKLDERFRGAIKMCQLGEVTQKEFASLFKIEVMTVKSRVFKAKASLRRSMTSMVNQDRVRAAGSRVRSSQAYPDHQVLVSA
jgi:RNA polymerase sigma-70 factor (ECF subfamily)